MPIAKIEVCRARPAAEVAAMMEAVHQAQQLALKVPADDRQIRYVEHRPEHFPMPPSKSLNEGLLTLHLSDALPHKSP
ncbi:hypothetical protein RQP53_18935 [Paucibacter sp. APW11]|uniref:Uncharacterized protein n=1 Tax=Roseateles aquae TaxID=3077235 RepID=A0ABU3PGY0_9BURK|nr:hypothetical protein [Paucibacter sp. APW11]MDT9001363.1 hypothetical protein [Paucibacter sp. APW11]